MVRIVLLFFQQITKNQFQMMIIFVESKLNINTIFVIC